MSVLGERLIATGIAIKKESPQGTWAVPTMAADAIRTSQPPSFQPGWAHVGKSGGFATGGFGRPLSTDPRGRFGIVRIQVPLTTSGTAITPPRWGRMLEPMMAEVVGGSDVSYQFADTDQDTLSLLVQLANKQAQLRGSTLSSLVLRGSVGRPCFWDAEYVGIFDVNPTEQALETQTFSAQSLPALVMLGASILTVGGTALAFRSFELDFRIQAQTPREMTNANVLAGLEPGVITQVDPIIRIPSKVVALATHDPFSRIGAASTPLAFSLTIGDPAARKVIITGDHVEYDPEGNLGPRDEGQLFWYDLDLGFIRPSGGTWFKVSHA